MLCLKIKNRLDRLLPLSAAQTHWKTGLFTPNANSSPGRVIGCWSRPRKPDPRTPEFDFIRHPETIEDLLRNLCLVLVQCLRKQVFGSKPRKSPSKRFNPGLRNC